MPCPYGIAQDFYAAFRQTWYKIGQIDCEIE